MLNFLVYFTNRYWNGGPFLESQFRLLKGFRSKNFQFSSVPKNNFKLTFSSINEFIYYHDSSVSLYYGNFHCYSEIIFYKLESDVLFLLHVKSAYH